MSAPPRPAAATATDRIGVPVDRSEATAATGSRRTDRQSARVSTVEQARAGDCHAFEALVEPWIEPAFRRAMAILGNEADARDATQEALVDAWRGIRRLRDADRFDAWLGRIHTNACHTIARRRGRARIREIPIAAVLDPEDLGAPGQPLDTESAELDVLERAFDQLSVAERSVLVLHHLEQRPVAQIATALGIAEGTVKWRLHAARAALARHLEEERR